MDKKVKRILLIVSSVVFLFMIGVVGIVLAHNKFVLNQKINVKNSTSNDPELFEENQVNEIELQYDDLKQADLGDDQIYQQPVYKISEIELQEEKDELDIYAYEIGEQITNEFIISRLSFMHGINDCAKKDDRYLDCGSEYMGGRKIGYSCIVRSCYDYHKEVFINGQNFYMGQPCRRACQTCDYFHSFPVFHLACEDGIYQIQDDPKKINNFHSRFFPEYSETEEDILQRTRVKRYMKPSDIPTKYFMLVDGEYKYMEPAYFSSIWYLDVTDFE